MLTDIGTIPLVLLLQVIMKGGRVAIRMSRCGLRPEATQMTQKVASLIALVAHKLLLLRGRGRNHGGLRQWGHAAVQFLRAKSKHIV